MDITPNNVIFNLKPFYHVIKPCFKILFAPLHGDGEHGGDGGRDGEVGDEGGDLAEHQPEHPVPAWRTATDYPEYLGLCDVIIYLLSRLLFYSTGSNYISIM